MAHGIFDLVTTFRVFSCSVQILGCGMWDPVLRSGIKPESPALGPQTLSHWMTREILQPNI